MERIELLDFVELDATSVDIIFVTDQDQIPVSISSKLDDEGATWKKLSVEQFIGPDSEYPEFGTVVIDTSEIREEDHKELWKTIKKLEQANIGAILLNDHISFPFDRFPLATLLQTVSVEEMWGRIETNLAFQRSLSVAGSENLQTPRPVVAEDTTEQLKMAGHVQRNFLPQKLPNLKNIRWSALFEPADWVSGDIYDVARLDEQHIGFYIADAVGHSMPAALLTMFLKQAIKMRETTGNDYRIFGPVEVINNLNVAMSDQHLAGCLFATCCYCLVNVRTLQMTYTRAGHPYPILVRKGEEPVQLESRGGLLGVFESTEFDQHTIQLQQGDKVFVYSDGCEGLVGGTEDNGQFVFGKEFLSITDLSIDKMITEFGKIVGKQDVKPAEVDDVTAVGFEII